MSLLASRDGESRRNRSQSKADSTADNQVSDRLMDRRADDSQVIGYIDAPVVSSDDRFDPSALCDTNSNYLRDTPDSLAVETFATAIDEIIGGRKTSTRARSRTRAERAVLCEKCGASFASVGNLNRHRRVSHQGVRVFCEFKACKQV